MLSDIFDCQVVLVIVLVLVPVALLCHLTQAKVQTNAVRYYTKSNSLSKCACSCSSLYLYLLMYFFADVLQGVNKYCEIDFGLESVDESRRYLKKCEM